MNNNKEEKNNIETNKIELNESLKKDKNEGGFSFFDSVNFFTGFIDFIKYLFK